MKVIQCWDDGPATDARLADLLRKYQAKATFNPFPGAHRRQERIRNGGAYQGFQYDRPSLDELKDIYRGFMVGGHTMTHSRLTEVSPEQLKNELSDNREIIRELFGQPECGMAYPYGAYDEAIKNAVRAAGYRYARTTRNSARELLLEDPLALHPHCKFSSPDFWRLYEMVKAANGVFYFWGHSFELMDDPALWDEFEAKVARISADPQAEWINVIDLFIG